MKIDWKFQPNEDGTSQGWNDSTIAQFKANRMESLTRETIQNSLDARFDNSQPVIVEFQEHTRKIDEIPNYKTLKKVLNLCESDKSTQNPDMIRELSLAIKAINDTRIRILSISDRNTTGMQGPCESGQPFYNYVKAVGQSGGPMTRAGSHGLGKGAPLSCSTLRSIFVATKWRDGSEEKALIQGRAVLMSFRDKGKIHKGTGYWGYEKDYQAVDPSVLDTKYGWLVRDEVGSTIHLLGWTSTKEWQQLIIGYAISSFFAAFARNTLILRVQGIEVNSANLMSHAESPSVRKAMVREKAEDKLEDAIAFLACIRDEKNVIQEESQLPNLGRTSIRLMVYEKAPRKIAMIRRDMLITSCLPGFWKRIPTRLADFVGVVEVLDPVGSQLIRGMEPPAHDSLSKDWLPTPEDQKKGQLALDRLTEELKKFVDRHAGGDSDLATRIEFMADFFEDEAGDDRGNRASEEIDPNGRFRFSPKPIKLPTPTRIPGDSDIEPAGTDESLGDEDEPLDDRSESEGSGSGGAGLNDGAEADDERGTRDGPAAGDGTLGEAGDNDAVREEVGDARANPGNPRREFFLENIRIVKCGTRSAKVFLTAPSSITARLRLHEIGADIAIPFEILESDQGKVDNGSVVVKLKSKERLCIQVTLSRAIIGGLKLVATN
jgi:hypothetical protein